MVGFPYYNDVNEEIDSLMLSDYVYKHSKYFILGFTLALSFSPGVAFADEIPNMAQQLVADVPGNQTAQAKIAANSVAVLSSTKAYQCLADAMNVTAEEAAKAAAKSGNSKLIAGAVCVFAVGWCAGQIVNRAIRRAL